MEDFDFEKSMNRLKEIVATLEDELLPLDRAMKLFEEGCLLANNLKKYINEAKQKVEMYSKEIIEDITMDGYDEREDLKEHS